jgi:hypothetical protein
MQQIYLGLSAGAQLPDHCRSEVQFSAPRSSRPALQSNLAQKLDVAGCASSPRRASGSFCSGAISAGLYLARFNFSIERLLNL